MAQLIHPDIPGSFQQGRQYAQRNALADMQLGQATRDNYETNQVGNILSTVGQVQPGQQQNYLNRLASQGSQGMAAAGKVAEMFKGMSEQQRAAARQRIEDGARILATVRDPQTYAFARQQLIQQNPNVADKFPEQYNPQLVEMRLNEARSISEVLGGGTGGETYGVNPVLTTDEQGNVNAFQLGNRGGQRQVDFGEGRRPVTRAPIRVDRGDSVLIVDPVTNQVLREIPKQLPPEKDPENIRAGAAASSAGQQDIKRQVEQAKNERTLESYNVAVQGLGRALSGTETGPLAGRMPSVTESQQIAEGAIAAFRPILKAIFRGPGEGTFTDQDQLLLDAMIPNRKDAPGAIQYKIGLLDSIVKAKLGGDTRPAEEIQKDLATQSGPPPGYRLMVDGKGNRAYVGPNNEVIEIR